MQKTPKMIQLIFITICLFSTKNIVQAQSAKPELIGKYINIDTLSENKDDVLILFKDNTFLNYGIFNNKEEKENYIWYTSGKWIATETKLLFKSIDPVPNSDQLIKSIKNSYRKRLDHLLIENYYEFVKLNYVDHPFTKKEGKLIDESKKISYIELK